MMIVNLLPFLTGVIACILGLIVLFSAKKDGVRIPFFLFSFSMGVWAIGISYFLLTNDTTTAKWFAVGYYIAALMLVYGFLLFCISSSRVARPSRLSPGALTLGVPIAIMAAVVATPELMIQSVVIGSPNIVYLDAVWYSVYSIIFTTYGIFAIWLLTVAARGEKVHQKRLQSALIVRVMYVCLPAGAFFNLLLPLVGDYSLIMVGPLFVLPIIVMVFYGMTKHRLFDVRFAVVRTIVYFLALGSIVGLYFLIALGLSSLLNQAITGSAGLVISAVSATILALAFQPIKRFFDKLTSKLFYRDIYDGSLFFSQLSRILTSTTDLRDLLTRASEHIGKTLKSEQAFFFMRYNETNYMFAGTHRHRSLTVDSIRILDAYMDARRVSIVLCDDVDDTAVRKMLRQARVAVILPLYQANSIIGYLFMGDQRNGGYSSRDLRILESTPSELVIAIQNALSLQEVRQLNATLQQRIDEATKELRASNDKLQRLDAAKDEFVSMASHQLRTPLTSVKGYISMVLEGDAGKISDMQAKLLGEAFTSSERMVHLINDFLNVSRIQTGKFMIDRRAVDLAKVVGQEVDGLQTTAHAHDLKLKYRLPSQFPILYLDEGKIRQVIMNFIDNAIYYSREFSTITVKLATEGGDVIMSVHDTGMGVPLDEQKHLFTKFFRATNARRQRPDGTGVGIFLAKKVIVAHGGSMIFESVEGKGSTFGFRLPIKKLSLAPADDADKLDD